MKHQKIQLWQNCLPQKCGLHVYTLQIWSTYILHTVKIRWKFAFSCKRVCLLVYTHLTMYKHVHVFASMYKCICLLVQTCVNYTSLIPCIWSVLYIVLHKWCVLKGVVTKEWNSIIIIPFSFFSFAIFPLMWYRKHNKTSTFLFFLFLTSTTLRCCSGENPFVTVQKKKEMQHVLGRFIYT